MAGEIMKRLNTLTPSTKEDMNMANTRIIIGDTNYYGIWIQKENEHFWIMDANGGEQYMGTRAPSNTEIDAYRSQII